MYKNFQSLLVLLSSQDMGTNAYSKLVLVLVYALVLAGEYWILST